MPVNTDPSTYAVAAISAFVAIMFLIGGVATAAETIVAARSSQYVVAEVIACRDMDTRGGGSCEVGFVNARGEASQASLSVDGLFSLAAGQKTPIWVSEDGSVVIGGWRAWIDAGVLLLLATLSSTVAAGMLHRLRHPEAAED